MFRLITAFCLFLLALTSAVSPVAGAVEPIQIQSYIDVERCQKPSTPTTADLSVFSGLCEITLEVQAPEARWVLWFVNGVEAGSGPRYTFTPQANSDALLTVKANILVVKGVDNTELYPSVEFTVAVKENVIPLPSETSGKVPFVDDVWPTWRQDFLDTGAEVAKWALVGVGAWIVYEFFIW